MNIFTSGNRVKRITSVVITVVTGLLFLWSGYTKLFPVEYFETVLSDRIGSGSTLSSWLARLIIGGEWMLGGMLLLRWHLKKITVPATIFTLTLFGITLVHQLITEGNDNNCGCFGNVWIMSPAEALIKNVVMLALLILAVKISDGFHTTARAWLIPLFVTGMSLPFVFNPGEIVYPTSVFLENKEKIDLKLLYSDSLNSPPAIDLTKNKHVIAFMSLKCKHCQLTAYKLAVIHQDDPSLPLYFILNGDSTNLGDFFKETQSQTVPHNLFYGPEKFLSLSGPDLPSIIMVNNSYIEGRMN